MRGVMGYVLVALVLAAGCVGVTTARHDPRTETKSVDLGSAEMIRAEVEMPAGTLEISSETERLLDGQFTYTSEGLRPEVTYAETGFRGRLHVSVPSGTRNVSNSGENRWDVQLNGKVPMDLTVKLGAGQGELKLAGLTLRSLDLDVGVGQIDVDLTGRPWKRSCDISVSGGIGQLKVRVPRNVGVVAKARGGIGDIDIRGLRREEGQWVNDAYGEAPVTIRLDVKGGIGQIKISSEG